MPPYADDVPPRTPLDPSLAWTSVMFCGISFLVNMLVLSATGGMDRSVRTMAVLGFWLLILTITTVCILVSSKIKLKHAWKYILAVNVPYACGMGGTALLFT